MERKLVHCAICKQMTGLYRVERDEMKRKIYVCSQHPKKSDTVKESKHQDDLERFYKYVHEKFNYTCQETGKKLSYNNKHAAHILPKSKFDYFETDPRNGILLSWSIHGIVDKGSPAQRKELKVWNTIQKTRKLLLEEAGMTFDEKHWENVTY